MLVAVQKAGNAANVLTKREWTGVRVGLNTDICLILFW